MYTSISHDFSKIISRPQKSILYYKSKANKKYKIFNDQSFKNKFNGIILKKDYYIQNLFYKKAQSIPSFKYSYDYPSKPVHRNNMIPKQVILSINKKEEKNDLSKTVYSNFLKFNMPSLYSSRMKTEPCIFHNTYLKSSLETNSNRGVDACTDTKEDHIVNQKKIYLRANTRK